MFDVKLIYDNSFFMLLLFTDLFDIIYSNLYAFTCSYFCCQSIFDFFLCTRAVQLDLCTLEFEP